MSQSPAPSTTTSSPQTAAPAPSPATAPRASTYAVGAIPAFKPPVNYAAAASKSKPSPPAINGSDVQAAVIGSQSPATPAAQAIAAVAGAASGSSPTQASSAAGFNNSAANNRRQGQVDAVNVPASRVGTLKSGAADSVNFGNVNDKDATLSSSPAAPPAVNNSNVKAFGTMPAATGNAPSGGKPAINMHSFFTGGGSPSPSAQQGRSPQPSPSPLPQSQLSSTSATFSPRQSLPQAFVPGQQAFSPSPSPQQFMPGTSPYQQSSSSPYMQSAKTPSQNIPNGSPYGGPGGASQQPTSGPQSRSGSYVGSPVMQQQVGRPQQTGGRPSFGGPTSPRMPSVSLPQGQPMMYAPQQWPGQSYGYPYQAYGMPGYAPGQYGGPPSMGQSSASTPSAGGRAPTSGAPASAGIPPSPSPSHALNPASPGFTYASPQPQSAQLPTQHGTNPYAPHAVANTPLRALSGAISANEFRPSVDAATFTPSPRKSAAIQIRNPKQVQEEKERKEREEAAAKAAAGGDDSSASASKKAAEDSSAAVAAKKAEDDKAKAKAKAEADATAAAAAEKSAADEKAAADKKAADEAAQAKAKADAEAASAAAAAAAEKAKQEAEAEQKKKQQQAEAEAKVKAEAEAKAEKERKDKEESDAAAAASAKAKSDADAKREAAEKAAVEQKKPAPAPVEEIKQEADVRKTDTPAPSNEQVEAAKQASDATASAASTETSKDTAANTLAEARSALPSSLPAPQDNVTPSKGATAPSPSSAPSSAALAAARPIEDLNAVSYPDNIKSPRAELNADAQPGKYRYDREFLMQFMQVCTEKPDALPNLESIGMVDAGAEAGSSRGAFGAGQRRSSAMGPPAVPSRSGSMTGGFGQRSTSGGGVGGAFGGMGTFGQGALGTSEARFAASLGRSPSGAFPNRPGSMSRTSSQSGMMSPGGGFQPAGRSTSSRGGKRRQEGDGGRGGGGGGGSKHVSGDGFEGATLAPRSENGWVPTVVAGAPTVDPNSPEMVQRKVKALLNKLTLERFDSISKQILEWADKSVDETDGRILRQVIALIFEKATDEANFSEMYARLCRDLMAKVSNEIKDENVKTNDGKPVVGGALFRKYLLNRCQEDYEAGWKAKETATAAAAASAADDNAKKEANDKAEADAKDSGSTAAPNKEAEVLSDEYYAAQKAKRRGLGLVRFIGELYRFSMLTERIMHECIKKLLSNTTNPEEEDIESLCRLLTTVGQGLDNAKAKGHMDVYFNRMQLIANNPKVPSRMRFMIQDVTELRAQRWQPRNDAAGPKLISEIHADAQKQAEEASRRVASSGGKGLPRLHDQLSRPGSRRGQGRDNFGVPATGADGWSAPVPQRPQKAGDLSGFGRVRDSSPNISLGPSGAFANKAKAKAEQQRPATPSNPFALLSGAGDAAPEASSGSQRPKLVLAPRTKPLDGEEQEGEKAGEEEEEEDEDDDDGKIDPNATSMSRSEGERRAGNSVKEFFSVRSVSEGVESVKALPEEYRGFLIHALAEAAINKKADDVNITRTLFSEVNSQKLVKHEVFVETLGKLVPGLIDLAMDVPNAIGFTTSLLKGADITSDEVSTMAQTMTSEDDPDDTEEIERQRQAFLTAFEKLNA